MSSAVRDHWKAFPDDPDPADPPSLPNPPDPRYLRSLKRRAVRARVWHRLDPVHRAAINVVQQIMERADQGFVARVRKSKPVGAMINRAVHDLLRVLQSVPRYLPFGLRALLEGTRIATERIRTYDERGVFRWAPWARRWLQEEDVLIYLGANSLDSPRYGGL